MDRLSRISHDEQIFHVHDGLCSIGAGFVCFGLEALQIVAESAFAIIPQSTALMIDVSNRLR
jgi:hypothetical protein